MYIKNNMKKSIKMAAMFVAATTMMVACNSGDKEGFQKTENGLYYNIDIYPQWKDQALMEIELYSTDDKVCFPEGIRVIREVSGEKEFTNPAIARKPH